MYCQMVLIQTRHSDHLCTTVIIVVNGLFFSLMNKVLQVIFDLELAATGFQISVEL